MPSALLWFAFPSVFGLWVYGVLVERFDFMSSMGIRCDAWAGTFYLSLRHRWVVDGVSV
jgi:hypothetical protein